MGNWQGSDFVDTANTLHRDIILKYPIGKGGCGKVWKAYHKPTQRFLAVKQMDKRRLVARNSVFSVKNELGLLSRLSHLFISRIHSAFQDTTNLYLVTDFLGGGDLRFHLQETTPFTEPQVKFFLRCLILTLEYLHSQKVAHRDVKPENLVFDMEGYLHLVDFGNARKCHDKIKKECSGTLGYMAPEVLFKQKHDFSVDFFSMGVLMHELLLKCKPYKGTTISEMKEAMGGESVQLRKSQLWQKLTPECIDFCNKLLQLSPDCRLGINGIFEVKNHAWMRGTNWKALLARKLVSPFRVSQLRNFNIASVNQPFTDKQGRVDPEQFMGYSYLSPAVHNN